jgi:hypothetical protein
VKTRIEEKTPEAMAQMCAEEKERTESTQEISTLK